MKVTCQYCEKNTVKRILIERVPIEDITNELPENLQKQGYKEFACRNIIYMRGNRTVNRQYKWHTETCENHMIGKLKRKGEKSE